MKNENVWILNTIACVFCLVAGVVCFTGNSISNIAIGTLDILLSIINGILAVRGYRNR